MVKLKPHQEKGIKLIERFGRRVLIADDMGIGKTFQSLGWAHKYKEESMPILVVCPASAKSLVWKHSAEELGLRASVLTGRKTIRPGSSNGIRRSDHLYIINYEILNDWMPYLQKLGLRTTILDEVHYIKSPRARRSKAAKQIAKRTPFILALSGTPLLNRPIELYPTLNLIRPDLFPNRTSFAQRYCDPKLTFWGWDYTGASNLKELHNILRNNCMIRRTKKILKELPPKKPNRIITLDINNREIYEEAKVDIVKYLSKQSLQKARKAQNAVELVKMRHLLHLAAEGKMHAFERRLHKWLNRTDKKLVIFGYHQDILTELYNRHKDISVLFTGKTSATNKIKAVQQFQGDRITRLFIGNLQAAGVAINLTSASDAAFVELCFVPALLRQAEDRIYRIGQKNKVQVVYFVARDTIEEKLCRAVQRKMAVLDMTLDGKRHTKDMDLLNLMRKELYR